MKITDDVRQYAAERGYGDADSEAVLKDGYLVCFGTDSSRFPIISSLERKPKPRNLSHESQRY